MNTIYSYKFSQHRNLEASEYKFIVYHAQCAQIYDEIQEYEGLEALKHYQKVQKATVQQVQEYLKMLSGQEDNKKSAQGARKSTQTRVFETRAKAV
jgi:hypothetical protein